MRISEQISQAKCKVSWGTFLKPIIWRLKVVTLMSLQIPSYTKQQGQLSDDRCAIEWYANGTYTWLTFLKPIIWRLIVVTFMSLQLLFLHANNRDSYLTTAARLKGAPSSTYTWDTFLKPIVWLLKVLTKSLQLPFLHQSAGTAILWPLRDWMICEQHLHLQDFSTNMFLTNQWSSYQGTTAHLIG